jgi:cytochrome c oxidase cbb3-type subunit I/II
METVTAIIPMLWVRVLGGTMYLTGVIMAAINLVMTVRTAPDKLEDTVVEVPVRTVAAPAPTAGGPKRQEEGVYYDDVLNAASAKIQGGFHRALEGWGVAFTVLVVLAIGIGSVVEIVPMLIMRSNIPTIAAVKPLTPLEVEGREIYLSEGCYNCHSQMVRPFRHEIERYGEYSKPGESVYDHPFQWGSKRTGPDLAREGGKYPHLWHIRHLDDPRKTSPSSLMPRFNWLLEQDLDLSSLQAKMTGLRSVGVPYTDADIDGGVAHAQSQASTIAESIKAEGGPPNLGNKKVIALVAYLQRLGTDIRGEVGAPAPAPTAELGGAK